MSYLSETLIATDDDKGSRGQLIYPATDDQHRPEWQEEVLIPQTTNIDQWEEEALLLQTTSIDQWEEEEALILQTTSVDLSGKKS